jgi:hypothetical protein
MPRVQVRGDAHARKIENLKELQDVVSQIPQQRSNSPPQSTVVDKQASDAGDLLVLPAQATAIAQGMHHSFSTGSLDGLMGGNRRFSHARSQTEPHITISKSSSSSVTASDEESDSERQRKPQMVRKKSGELVRPALRPPSRRRPSSMPGTPTFSKAVHFDSHLEHVRHFLQVDRPLAVSAGSSPIDNYDSDTEYPFGGDDRTSAKSPSFEWGITMPTFPVETPARKAQTVRLERVWLSKDQKCLVGSIAVANLAFQKSVVCRFTLDYWKTTSEVVAEYISDIRPVDTPYPQDRFNFTIKLSDLANLESKTLYFCIRFNVNGQEHWDNNGGTNFQVDFYKKILPQNGKQGAVGAASRPVNGLPKSNRRPASATVQKPKVKLVGTDEFGGGSKINFDQSIHDYLGESRTGGLRLKGVKSAAHLPSDNLSSRLAPPSGQAFANRYDFGASLTLAIQTAKDSMSSKSDGLYMKPHWRAAPLITSTVAAKPTDKAETDKAARPTTVITAPPVGKPSIVPGTDSPGASISSASYEELVNKYCFFGSKQASPSFSHDPSPPSRFDGAGDGLRSPNNSSGTSSYEGSPVQMGNYHHSHSGTQHHSLHPKDPNPYFQQLPTFVAMGASPAESPIIGFPTQRAENTTVAPAPTGSGQKNDRSSGTFAPFAGTSPNEYPYQHMPDRFPFFGAEAHAATAIRG